MKSILDPTFKYTNAASTDVAKTFKRVREEQRRAAEATRAADEAEKQLKVRVLNRGGKV